MLKKPTGPYAYRDPKKLRDFFTKKGQPYLVIHTPDVMQMLQSDQCLYLQALKEVCGWDDHKDLELVERIKRSGFRGYVQIPIGILCDKLSMDALISWQGWVSAYQDVRLGKGGISKVEACDCTKLVGNGRPERQPNPKCNKCEGKGKLIILLEVSPLETALAEGKTWGEIDAAGI